MRAWDRRPSEVANLLNPPFCATLLGWAARGFATDREGGLPWLFAFLIVPLILHKPTRRLAPKTKVSKFQTWVQSNPSVLVGFAERARQVVPHVRETIVFGLASGLLTCNQSGNLLPGPTLPKKDPTGTSEEVQDCFLKARALGAVLAKAGEEHTVFALLGVKG